MSLNHFKYTHLKHFGRPKVMGKSYATLIQDFFVVTPEGAGKFLTWCNIAEGVLKLSDFFREVSLVCNDYFLIEWKHV